MGTGRDCSGWKGSVEGEGVKGEVGGVCSGFDEWRTTEYRAS